jgi:hypothetical protein
MNMIHETTEHLTPLDAKSKGETFKTYWGWGYNPSYRVHYDATKEVWVCHASRYSSCD